MLITNYVEIDGGLVDSVMVDRQMFVDGQLLRFKEDLLKAASLQPTPENLARVEVADLGRMVIETIASDGRATETKTVYRFRLDLSC